jgi:hypothetical protein
LNRTEKNIVVGNLRMPKMSKNELAALEIILNCSLMHLLVKRYVYHFLQNRKISRGLKPQRAKMSKTSLWIAQ